MTELARPPRRLRAFKDFTLDLDRGANVIAPRASRAWTTQAGRTR